MSKPSRRTAPRGSVRRKKAREGGYGEVARPTLFIGSSSEAKHIAISIADGLAPVAQVDGWWQSRSFRLSHSTLSGLLSAGRGYDFGLFILTPDDQLTSRGDKLRSARDNVLFEFGLFLGALGPDRVFSIIVHHGRKKVHVPSDLLGINLGQLRVAANGVAEPTSMQRAVESVRHAVVESGRNHGAIRLSNSWDFEDRGRRFYLSLSEARVRDYEALLRGKRLVLVLRIEDDEIDAWSDSNIIMSTPREISLPMSGRVKIAASVPPRAKDKTIFGRLFLVPPEVSLDGVTTMAHLRDRGCLLLDVRGKAL